MPKSVACAVVRDDPPEVYVADDQETLNWVLALEVIARTPARRSDGTRLEVNGHVEIRWSHGRFNGFPEAKVYLDTPHADVPGYYPLVGSSGPLTLL